MVNNQKNQKTDNTKGIGILYHFYTPLHCGSGTALSYVDLPVQREINTLFPVMPSSGVKGTFRADYEKKYGEEDTKRVFGSTDEEGELIFSDGKILLFPVKSARGLFVWVTCPFVIKRFIRDLKLIDQNVFQNDVEIKVNDDTAMLPDEKLLIARKLILEELSFQFLNYKSLSNDRDKERSLICKFIEVIKSTLKSEIDISKIAIISDNMFSYFVKHSTEVNARIKINNTTGVVNKGALWYEELVPAETVFYGIVFQRYKKHTEAEKDNTVIDLFVRFIESNNKGVFQFGGDETLGRGIAKVLQIKLDTTTNSQLKMPQGNNK